MKISMAYEPRPIMCMEWETDYWSHRSTQYTNKYCIKIAPGLSEPVRWIDWDYPFGVWFIEYPDWLED